MTYVMSDIHGNAARFDSVMAQIDLRPEDTLYVLGDVIDRYTDGIRILRRLMRMENVRMLLGNHEYMMLEALDTPFDEDDILEFGEHIDAVRLWYHNGGNVTHRYLNRIRRYVRREVFDYLRTLPLNLDIEVGGEKFRLVHGAPTEYYEAFKYKYSSVEKYAVWKRWDADYPDLDGEIMIFGHTPTYRYQDGDPLKIWHSPSGRRIGIDCGSGFPPISEQNSYIRHRGRLACLRLDDMKEFYSEENE